MKKILFTLITIFTLQPLIAMESDGSKRPRIDQSDEFTTAEQTIVPRPPAMPIADELQPPATSTQLSIAAQNGNSILCEWLINQGVNVNAQNNLGNTALMYAAAKGHIDVCRLLIARGAHVNGENSHYWGETPLMSAAAALKGHKKVCELLIAHGAHVNAQDNQNQTALMRAASSGHKDICELLIASNAQIEAQDNGGTTALIFAAYWCRREICKLLIANGARIEAHTNEGNTALMVAIAGRKNLKVCEFLIDHGANINAQNNQGETILHIAVYQGKNEICRLLLEHGANPNALMNDGTSVLMHGIHGEIGVPDDHKCRCVKLLLKYGADVNLLSDGKQIDYSKNAQNEECTAFMEAICMELPRELLELLLQYGADYTYKTKNGVSALTTINRLEEQIEGYAGISSLLTNPTEMHALMIRSDNPLLQKRLGNDSNNIHIAFLKRELGEK
jgi:ankyrin repeat protein